MGANKSSNKLNHTQELKSMFSEEYPQFEQFSEVRHCCGLSLKSSKKKKMEILWERKAIYFCEKYKNYTEWATDVIKTIKNCAKSSSNISKIKRFKRQFNDVKYLQAQSKEMQKQMSLTNAEILNFKSNLKNSVLLNENQIKRLHNQMIMNINSNLQVDDKQKISNMSLSKSDIYIEEIISSKGQIEKPKVNHSKNILRQSVISMVDDTITSIFKGQQKLICKLSAHSLEVFVKFTLMLQKHLTNPEHQIYQIIECFHNKIYLSHQKAKIKKITEESDGDGDISALQMEGLIHSIKIFIALLVEIIQDYYSIRVLDNRQEDVCYLICSYENLLTIVTAILFKNEKFYNFLFSIVMLFNKEVQLEYCHKFNELHGKSTQFFSIKKYYSMDSEKVKNYNENLSSLQSNLQFFGKQETENKEKPYRKCSQALGKLSKTRTPIAKMKTILECAQKISESISQFYTQNKMSLKKNMIDADQILSIFCYILSINKIDYLNSHMFIIDQFATDQQKMSMAGYYFSVISCAIDHFLKISAKIITKVQEQKEQNDEQGAKQKQFNKQQQRNREISVITFNKKSLLQQNMA